MPLQLVELCLCFHKGEGNFNYFKFEMQALGGDIRAVIITDFEKTSATTLVEGVMDDEVGGAVAAFRQAVECDNVDLLNPILMTGSTVLVDDDLAEEFLAAANNWIDERDLAITLIDEVRTLS